MQRVEGDDLSRGIKNGAIPLDEALPIAKQIAEGLDEAAHESSVALTTMSLSDKISYMLKASISVRELQQNLKRVLARVERGQVIEVTRRRRPVATLAPMHAAGATAPWPDLDARAQAVFGTRVLASSGSEAVSEGRGVR